APVGPQAHPTDQQSHPTPTDQQAHAFSQGTPGPHQYASAPGTDATQPYGGPVKPFDRRKATLVTVVAGGAVLLLVAALIVVNQVNGRMFGPEATVEKYFAELSDGDAEGALKVADVDVPQEARALLTNDVLSASKALPDDVTVDEPGLSSVHVNGIDVDTDGSSFALPAFPGLYTIVLAEKTDLISADPVEVRALLGDDADMGGEDVPQLTAQPSVAFRIEVANQ